MEDIYKIDWDDYREILRAQSKERTEIVFGEIVRLLRQKDTDEALEDISKFASAHHFKPTMILQLQELVLNPERGYQIVYDK